MIGFGLDRSRPVPARAVLVAMMLLQVTWLLSVWAVTSEGWMLNLVPGRLPETFAPSYQRVPLLVVLSLLLGLAILWLPPAVARRARHVRERLVLRERRVLLPFCVLVVITGALYAANHRGYSDEVRIARVTRVVATEGVDGLFEQYTEMHWLRGQHPPLIVLMYGFTLRAFGASFLFPRLVSFLFSLGVLKVTYEVARLLYDEETGMLATLMWLSMPIFLWVGATALADMPMTFFFTAGLYLMMRSLARPGYRAALGAGICVGLGLLSKYLAVLVYPVVLGYAALYGGLSRMWKYLVVFAAISLALLAVWLSYAYSIGVIEEQARVIGRHTNFMTKDPDAARWALGILFVRLLPALGVYNLPLILAGVLVVVRRRQRADLFVALWIAAVSVPLLFTLPEHRYFMPAFPALTITMAHGLRRLAGSQEQVLMLGLVYAGCAALLRIS